MQKGDPFDPVHEFRDRTRGHSSELQLTATHERIPGLEGNSSSCSQCLNLRGSSVLDRAASLDVASLVFHDEFSPPNMGMLFGHAQVAYFLC